ncbi:paired box protein Pax-6-like [Orbicella faveolata]|uniref:paired box protein Pax-6-like n=1 Tax=Orbicella faveolata TaxID=48498 RepID=UPI0009E430C5|nr:paired box protein Pax-6-like [Orbicella faveolata]
MEYRKEQPGLFSWEIRDRLVQESLCSKESPPSLSSISRLLKNKDELDITPGNIGERNSNSYTIASILNLPPFESRSSSSIPSSMASTSTDSHVQLAEQKQTENTQDAEDSRETFPLRIERRERIKYTSHQLHELETVFRINQYPSVSGREHLARKIGVTESQIQVWFSNQRAKCKARRHSSNEADSRTNNPNYCTCRRISASNILLRIMGPGTSRVFFPPCQR